MSMLAEPKRKQRWYLNPRGKLWNEDKNGFGQKMLEKMGWKDGKGLGANEDGVTESLKVKYKNDSKGMGYKDKEEWTALDDNFSSLLQNLNGKVEGISSDVKVTSLQDKVQNCKARINYHKFTRAKDVSRYSEKDLANIFGKKSLKRKVLDVDENKGEDETNDSKKGSDNLINKGSMSDYFKTKLNKRKMGQNSTDEIKEEMDKINQTNGKNRQDGDILVNKGSMADYFKKKFPISVMPFSRNIEESESENERVGFGFSQNIAEDNKKLEDKHNEDENIIPKDDEAEDKAQDCKKRKRKYTEMFFPYGESTEFQESHKSESSENSIPHKKKKKKSKRDGEIEINVTQSESSKKSKKYSTDEQLEKCSNKFQNETLHHQIQENEEKQSKKKNKKSKKSERNDSGGISNPAFNDFNSNSPINFSLQAENEGSKTATDVDFPDCCEIKPKKKKKKKSVGIDNPALNLSDDSDKKGESSGIHNPALNLSDILDKNDESIGIDHSAFNSSGVSKKKKKKSRHGDNPSSSDVTCMEMECKGIDNPGLNLNSSHEEGRSNPTLNLNGISKKKKKSRCSDNANSGDVPDKEMESHGIDNPALNLNNTPEEGDNSGIDNSVLNLSGISKKKKKKSKYIDDPNVSNASDKETTTSSIDNPALNCNDNSYEKGEDNGIDKPALNLSGTSKKKKKKSKYIDNLTPNLSNASDKETKTTGIDNLALNLCDISDGDLILNVVNTPVILKKPSVEKFPLNPNITKVKPTRRKSVRFSDVLQERIIPNDPSERINEYISNRNELFDINTMIIEEGIKEEMEKHGVKYEHHPRSPDLNNFMDPHEINKKIVEGSIKEELNRGLNTNIGIINEGFDIRSVDKVNFYDNKYDIKSSTSKDVGIDNKAFNQFKNQIEENVESIRNTIDKYQVEVENNINECKEVSSNPQVIDDWLVGDVGSQINRNVRIEEGTKLCFKEMHFRTSVPHYLKGNNISRAKRTYRHLIRGDVTVAFKNSNLHDIQGYAVKARERITTR